LTKSAFDVRAVSVHQNGKRVAVSTDDPDIMVLDLKEGTETGEGSQLTGHTKSVACLAFHPNSPTLLSTDTDGCIKVWEKCTSGWRCKKTLDILVDHAEESSLDWYNVAWNISGTHFAVAGHHGGTVT
jgi:WD40 repeat protein